MLPSGSDRSTRGVGSAVACPLVHWRPTPLTEEPAPNSVTSISTNRWFVVPDHGSHSSCSSNYNRGQSGTWKRRKLGVEIEDRLTGLCRLDTAVGADGQDRIGFRDRSPLPRYRPGVKGSLDEPDLHPIFARPIGPTSFRAGISIPLGRFTIPLIFSVGLISGSNSSLAPDSLQIHL